MLCSNAHAAANMLISVWSLSVSLYLFFASTVFVAAIKASTSSHHLYRQVYKDDACFITSWRRRRFQSGTQSTLQWLLHVEIQTRTTLTRDLQQSVSLWLNQALVLLLTTYSAWQCEVIIFERRKQSDQHQSVADCELSKMKHVSKQHFIHIFYENQNVELYCWQTLEIETCEEQRWWWQTCEEQDIRATASTYRQQQPRRWWQWQQKMQTLQTTRERVYNVQTPSRTYCL
jgi:hypothetical protein